VRNDKRGARKRPFLLREETMKKNPFTPNKLSLAISIVLTATPTFRALMGFK
jgi:hypothetical protein